jgi:diguanylate cyclase (GGDEF)-like protein
MNRHPEGKNILPPRRRVIRIKIFLTLILLFLLVLVIMPAGVSYLRFTNLKNEIVALENSLPRDEISPGNRQAGLKNLEEEIRRAQNDYLLTAGAQIVMALIMVMMLYRHFFLPVRLVAKKLRLMKLGRKSEVRCSSRIAELEEIFGMVSKMENTISELEESFDNATQEKKNLEELSMKDGLTGVSNRRCFDQRLTRAHRGDSIAILMIDVDKFKNYNDFFGHQIGDFCLVKVATTIQEALFRSSDNVFRYGGEEFVVILENVVSETAAEVGRRIKTAVQKLRIPHPTSGIGPHVTVSIGVAVARKGEFNDAKELVRQADKALYRAKAAGRNSVCLYDKEIDEKRPDAQCPPDSRQS